MLYKKLLLLILLLFACFNGFCAVFVVTSNADSGPGTLRDALTQAAANGSAERDYINFNLADLSEAGRTIILLTDLPVVSSNLVIDGTSQQGVKLGVSDAKIKIIALYNAANTVNWCFNLSNQHDIEIYGFLMDSLGLTASSQNSISGIYGVLVRNVIIGAPGKGNITKNVMGVNFNSNEDETEMTVSENIKISSNILGLNEDGETVANNMAVSLSVERVKDLTLGGPTAAEGNIFSGQVNISSINTNFTFDLGALIIANNLFGANVSGTKPIPNLIAGSTLSVFAPTLKNLLISQNVFIAQSDVDISNVGCFFYITGNKFGTDITGANTLGTFQFPLILAYCSGGGIIGGTNAADQNIFAGAYEAEQATYQIQYGVIINVGSPGVEVTGNAFRCNYSMYPYALGGYDFSKYYVNINTRSLNTISGTATPSSRIDLYYSISCDHCEPEKQFTSVNADANGKWVYNGALSNYNIIASSTFEGTTSEFTALRFSNQPADVKIKMACGGGNNGSITGLTTNIPVKYNWYNSAGKQIDTSKDLINVPAGKYYLIVNDGYCSSTTPVFIVPDASNQIDTTAEKINLASCNQHDGSITGIKADLSSSFEWTDQAGNIVGYYSDLTGIPTGAYTLKVTPADGSCSQTLPPIIVKNTTGPNIDQSKQTIQSTPCGQSTGSITNLIVTGTGTLKYIWWDSNQQTVGTNKDLLNQPAGTYKLQVTDDTQCGPIYTTDIVIPETNGITMDESKAQATIAMCGLDNGSITGIQVTGAAKYVWAYGNSTLITTTSDLLNMPPGDYVLTASNSFGCSKISQSYHIGQQLATQFPVYASVIVPACFKSNNGSVSVTTDALVKSLRWVDGQGQNAGANATLAGIGAGAYQLYLTDQNGCESFYNTYTITEFPEYTVALYGTVTTDKCGLSTGGVSATTIAGGVPPYTYKWRDANNNPLGATNAITNLSAGTYILNVVDTRCGDVDITYTIAEDSENIPAPSVSNIQLCSAGEAIIKVNHAGASVAYRLYDNLVSPHVVDEQKGGSFKVNITANQSFYISQLNGTCESERAEVQVTVGLSAKDIVNTFTPNGDGINDYWKMNNIESYPLANIQVFSRNGQLVFNSIGYAHPFDGTFNGKKLPAGVYYYVINLGTSCKILSGSLTIIR